MHMKFRYTRNTNKYISPIRLSHNLLIFMNKLINQEVHRILKINQYIPLFSLLKFSMAIFNLSSFL